MKNLILPTKVEYSKEDFADLINQIDSLEEKVEAETNKRRSYEAFISQLSQVADLDGWSNTDLEKPFQIMVTENYMGGSSRVKIALRNVQK